jgi:hypothetical protein
VEWFLIKDLNIFFNAAKALSMVTLRLECLRLVCSLKRTRSDDTWFFWRGEDSWPTSVIYISKVELTFREVNAIRSVKAVVKNAGIMG